MGHGFCMWCWYGMGYRSPKSQNPISSAVNSTGCPGSGTMFDLPSSRGSPRLLRCLNSFLPFRPGHKNVLPDEAVFRNHLDRVLEAAQVGVGVICAERELCPRRFGLL